MEWTPIIVALVAAFLGGGGVFLWRAQRRKTEAEALKAEAEALKAEAEALKAEAEANKNNADASAVITATALNILKRWEGRVLDLEKRVGELESDKQQLQQRVDGLGKRVTCLETENTNLRAIHVGAKMLENQVVGLGETPVFKVPAQA